MSVSKGNCYLCGKEIGKTAMKNHIIKNHAVPEGQECCLLKIEGAYEKDYWLYIDIPVESTLKTLDSFLRKIWLECCGHMSAFRSGGGNAGMGRKLKDFETGEQLLHEYDFGSTTETLVTFMGTVYRERQRGVRLLARNVPPEFSCCKCGRKAEYVDVEEMYSSDDVFYCRKCAEKYEEQKMFLPVTNSPRMGVCGYSGELDTFEFSPDELTETS